MPWSGWIGVLGAALAMLSFASAAAAEDDEPPPRPAVFRWLRDMSGVIADFGFREVVDAEIQQKLSRGLPTTFLFTGFVYVQGRQAPVATTLQSCRVTWHVWEEMYRVEVNRANSVTPRRHWTPTITGVLRRCAEADGLLIADRTQVSAKQAIFVRGKVEINPISPELMDKIKRWISRPGPTRTVTVGSTLFSTFTGLFMQRVEDAERSLEILTVTLMPLLPPPEQRSK